MQRAAQTFHLPTPDDGWRTIAAGDELADDDPAVQAAPQCFTPVTGEQQDDAKPAARSATRRKSSK